VLLGMVVLSAFWVTALPGKSTPQALRLVGGVWLFYAIARWGCVSQRRLRLLVVGFLAAGLVLALAALFTVDWSAKFSFIPTGLIHDLAPILKDVIHPNVMAGSLVLILAGTVGGLVFGWGLLRKWQRILLIFAGVWMMGILVLTQSRGALLGLGAALVLMVVLRFRRGWVALPVCLVLGLGLMLAVTPTRLFDALSRSQGTVSSLDGRLEIWSRAVYMIEDFPFTGVGIGTFTEVADTLYPFFTFDPGTVTHAHNLFLQIAVDVGLPGLAAWLAIWGAVILAAWKVFRAGRQSRLVWQMALGAGLLAAQAALGVHGVWDAVTWGSRPVVLVWAMWGFSLAAWRLVRSGERPDQKSTEKKFGRKSDPLFPRVDPDLPLRHPSGS
jgi:putative inorganic carbon (HCO3(-)) transporter